MTRDKFIFHANFIRLMLHQLFPFGYITLHSVYQPVKFILFKTPHPAAAMRTMPAQSRLTFKISVLCPTADVNKSPSPIPY